MDLFDFLSGNWPNSGCTVDHAVLVLEGLGLATVVGRPLAVLVYRTALPRAALSERRGPFLTIPSDALFGLLITRARPGWTSAQVRPCICAR
ncbi:hypothetical protein [Streptomyces sp. bgisy031]|uniref:hypothetical protein n=1 Tax=Streptomyces sp. bgisy031 TaxID=3413772 RepID=UPI003D708C35